MKKYILPVFLGLLAAAGITFAETNDDSGGWFFDGTNATINNNVAIPGDLTVSGTCTGCAASETDPIVGAITGIVKADGATNIAAAVAGTDYAAPNQTMYIGTTAVAINRATAALTLAGITLTTPNLGTPSTLIGTNITGTAASFSIGGSAATVTGFTPASGSLTLSGADAVTITTTGATNSTLPLGTNTLAANDQNFYIGTTQVAINRASAALTLAGITLTTADIGTPSAGTLTNATGLPLTGLVDDTTTALGVGTLELGHATDTTLSRSAAGVLAVEGVVIPSISSTSTFTNKRTTARVATFASDATPDVNSDNYDAVTITALAAAITDVNMTGTETNFQKIIFRIKDDDTARAITWGSDFEDAGVALPITTVASKLLTVGFIYNTVTAKWGCVAVGNET